MEEGKSVTQIAQITQMEEGSSDETESLFNDNDNVNDNRDR